MGDRENGGLKRVDGRPDGVPLGRAFLIGSGLANDPLRKAVDVVARVHGDGDLPQIPVVWDTSLDVRARFVIRDGLPSAIAVRPGHSLTVPIIHEIGHFLDFAAIDGFGSFASLRSPRLARWSMLVRSTATVRSLADAIDRVRFLVDPAHPIHRRLATFLSIEELWARCYAQHDVRQHARADLRADLENVRSVAVDDFVFPLHGDEREFDPIADEIDRIFRSLGWRRNRV
jgi:hypothetical protein